MPRARAVCVSLGCLVLILSATSAALPAEDEIDVGKLVKPANKQIDFDRDIEPIFRKSCHSCHGPDIQESGLRLDTKQGVSAGGAAIKLGDSARSRLIHLVAGIDPDGQIMPPEGEGAPLSREQVALLRAWIDQGAEWPEGERGAPGKPGSDRHWAFQPVEHAPPPKVNDTGWARNEIDLFVLARLESAGIKPSGEADRVTLMRRLYLDLVGLSPEPTDVEAFLHDMGPGAYERLVDRLLASPHYGERWGRHWLDLARYADSDGYEKDRPRPHAWRYRDWVIDALNRDLPYDEFSIQQIAGDLLPNATSEQRVATGFHRNTLHNTEGGTDKEEDRVKKTADRLNTAGALWLGLTIGCAQCHSHKYDPITQREFYEMFAFFNDIDEVDIAAPLRWETERYERAKAVFDRRRAAVEADIAEYAKTELAAAQAAWEASLGDTPQVWAPLKVTAASAQGATLKSLPDGSLLAGGPNEDSDVYTIEGVTPLERITAIRLEVLPDKSLSKNGPGRAKNGNFVLSSFRVTVRGVGRDEKPVPVVLQNARADFSQQGWSVAAAINNDPKDGWAVSPQFGKRHVAVFETKQEIALPGGARLTITLDQTYKSAAHNLGRFRVSVSRNKQPVELEGLPESVAKILAVAPRVRNEKQRAELADYYRSVDVQLAGLSTALAAHDQKAPKAVGTKAQTVSKTSQPRQTHIHIRGDFLSKGDPVEASTPRVLHPLKVRGPKPDRLDLAYWLVDPANPLTARVTVNRLWQHHFGRGLVFSNDDFGSQGDEPSHPRLLDQLAGRLVAHGWSLKAMHRLIVTSATYRQSSATRAALVQIDPDNVSLARQSRRRVESEIIRDVALVASGLLHRAIGGRSVRPAATGGGRTVDLCQQRQVVGQWRRRPIPAWTVHVLPTDIALPHADDVRLTRFQHQLHAPLAEQYAHPSANPLERPGILRMRARTGAARCQRSAGRHGRRGGDPRASPLRVSTQSGPATKPAGTRGTGCPLQIATGADSGG